MLKEDSRDGRIGERVARWRKTQTPDGRAWAPDELKRYLSVEKRLAGFSMIKEIEAGGYPWEKHPGKLQQLEDALGTKLDDPAPEPAASESDGSLAAAIRQQAAAIDRQAKAIEALVGELQASRASGPAAGFPPGALLGEEQTRAMILVVSQTLRGLGLLQADSPNATPPNTPDLP